MSMKKILSLLLCGMCLIFSSGANHVYAGTIYGTQIATNNGNIPVYCDPPTTLFEIDTATDTVTSHGNVLVQGLDVRVEGLACQPGKLVGFVISDPVDSTATSQLIEFDMSSLGGTEVAASPKGAEQNYFACAAAYSTSGQLWAIDNISGKLYQINDNDGSIITTVTLSGGGYAPQTNAVLDLAFSSTNICYIVGNTNYVWKANVNTGVMTRLTGASLSSGLCGCALDPDDDTMMYAFRTFGGDDTVKKFSVAGDVIGTEVNLGSIRTITNNEGGRGDLASLGYTELAKNPTPGNGSILIAIDTDLSWEAPDLGTPSSYTLNYRADDNDFGAVGTTVVSGITGLSYEFPADLINDTTYYWRVDAIVGGSTKTGSVWNFTTIPQVPYISADPQSTISAIGDPAEFSIVGLNIESYKWYRSLDAANNTPGDDTQVGTDATLLISGVQQTDEGYYYCEASNGAGLVLSNIAQLWTKRLMAHWKFEDNLNDQLGIHHGSFIDPNENNPTPDPSSRYVAGGVSGKAFEFTGDGLIVEIPGAEWIDFYPLGMTASCWIKLDAAQTETVNPMRNNEPGYNGGFYMHIYANGNAGGGIPNLGGSINATSVFADDAWHLLTITYDGVGTMKLFADGEYITERVNTGAVVALPEVPLVFGGRITGEASLVGYIDEIRIFSYPLDNVAVAHLYTDLISGVEICAEDPTFDFDGDCIVNLNDFAKFTEEWMLCNVVPTCK